MKCINCGSSMTTKRENVPYTALPGVVLQDVNVSRCPKCGETEVAITAIDELNKVLAEAVISAKGRLNGAEIRFLRTYLGYSGADFAKAIGSSPATVSRWESDTQPIGHHADLLLRSLVVIGKKVESYPLEALSELGSEKPSKKASKKSQRYFSPSGKHWKSAEATA